MPASPAPLAVLASAAARSLAPVSDHRLVKDDLIDEPVPSAPAHFRHVSDQAGFGKVYAALGPGGLSRARINRITRSAARGVHGIPSGEGFHVEQLDGSSPERPPIDAQLEAFGYVGQGISEQDPAGVSGTRRPYDARGDLRSGSAG